MAQESKEATKTKNQADVLNQEVNTEAASQTETVENALNESVTETIEKKSKEGKVTFRLFRDNDKYKAPVFVGVNGVGYLVERGKDVTMPRAVFEVLKNSEEQLAEASKVMEEAQYQEN